MKQDYGRQPDIIDVAYQIIALHEENAMLRQSRDHYKEMYEMHCETLNSIDKQQKEFVGTMLTERINPDSDINKAHAALAREDLADEVYS